MPSIKHRALYNTGQALYRLGYILDSITSFLCFCVPSFARVILAFGLIFLLTVFRRAGVCGFAFHPLCPENEVRNGGVPGVSPTFAVLDPDQLHLSKKKKNCHTLLSCCFRRMQPVLKHKSQALLQAWILSRKDALLMGIVEHHCTLGTSVR